MSTPAELLAELQAAHTIIRNALAVMTTAQKLEWGTRNARDGVDGEGITRAHERMTVIERADQAEAPAEHSAAPIPAGGDQVEICALQSLRDRMHLILSGDTDPPDQDESGEVQALRDALASARAELLAHQVQALVSDSLRSGALQPLLKEWATSYGLKDINALRGFLDTSRQIQHGPADTPTEQEST